MNSNDHFDECELRLLHVVIGRKISPQFLNQWEAIPEPIAPRTRDFLFAWSKLQLIVGIRIGSSPVVIRRNYYFGIGFSNSHLKTALF